MHPDLFMAVLCSIAAVLLLLAGLAGAVWENRRGDEDRDAAANPRQGGDDA